MPKAAPRASFASFASSAWQLQVYPHDVLTLLPVWGIRPAAKNPNGWLQVFCPFHEDTVPSAEINLDDKSKRVGYFRCNRCLDKKGQIEWLYAQRNACSVKEARRALSEIFNPLETTSGQQSLPTEQQLNVWRNWIFNVPEAQGAMEYFDAHAISNEVVMAFGLGWEAHWIKVPVFDATERLVQCKSRTYRKEDKVKGKNKIVAVGGHGQHVYPAWKFEWDDNGDGRSDRPFILCEGEPDCLALWSIGIEAVTHTGGAEGWNLEKFHNCAAGPFLDQQIYLVPHNDDAGRAACKRFSEQLLHARYPPGNLHIVNIIPGDFKDIAEFLAHCKADERKAQWDVLVDRAEDFPTTATVVGKLLTRNGGIYEGDELIVPWTGVVTEWSDNRVDRSAPKRYTIKLTHADGEERTISHTIGDVFARSIHNSPGDASKFNLLEAKSDLVLNLVIASSRHAEQRDIGGIVGWDSAKRDRFVTKEWIFEAGGRIAPNNEVVFEEANKSNLKWHEDPEQAKRNVSKATHLVWHTLLITHEAKIMLPLILTAYVAPIRRWLCPSDQRWNTFLQGPVGSGKSSRARYVQNLFGKFTTDSELLTWYTTHTQVEVLMAKAGDTLIVVDELKRELINDKEFTNIQRLLQATGQGSGRGRWKQAAGPEPAALPLITCNEPPLSDQSTASRSLIITFPRMGRNAFLDPVLLKPAQEIEANFDMLPFAITGWINWLQRWPDIEKDWRELEGEMRQKVATYLAEEVPESCEIPGSDRLTVRFATMSVVLDMALKMALECGGIDDGQAFLVNNIWWHQAMKTVAQTTAMEVGDTESADDSLLDSVIGLLLSGHYYLDILPGGGRHPNKPESRTCIGCIQVGVESYGIHHELYKNAEITWNTRTCQVWLYASTWTSLSPKMTAIMGRKHLIRQGLAMPGGRAWVKGKRGLLLTTKGATEILGAVS